MPTSEQHNAAIDRIMQADVVDQMSGGVPCPICQTGTLTWARLPEHGTCWVSCTSADCVHLHINMGSRYQSKH